MQQYSAATRPTLAATAEDSDVFYERLDSEIRQTPRSNKVILFGDFNTRVGSNHMVWEKVLGRHGLGNMKMNGHRLLTLCAQNELFVNNRGFQLEDAQKGTWTYPRLKHAHMIDYCFVRQRDRQDVLITRAMRGADCWTTSSWSVVSSLYELALQQGNDPRKISLTVLHWLPGTLRGNYRRPFPLNLVAL